MNDALPTEPWAVIAPHWATRHEGRDDMPTAMVLEIGPRSGTLAWRGLANATGVWGARALAEEITGFEVLSVPLSVEDRELIASALYSLARQTDTPTSGYMRALALAARIAPDQSSLVSRVQAGGHA